MWLSYVTGKWFHTDWRLDSGVASEDSGSKPPTSIALQLQPNSLKSCDFYPLEYWMKYIKT